MPMTDSIRLAATRAVESAQPIRVRLASDRRAHVRTGWPRLAGDAAHMLIRRIVPSHSINSPGGK